MGCRKVPCRSSLLAEMLSDMRKMGRAKNAGLTWINVRR